MTKARHQLIILATLMALDVDALDDLDALDVDASWGVVGSWTTCSATCGPGVSSPTRVSLLYCSL